MAFAERTKIVLVKGRVKKNNVVLAYYQLNRSRTKERWQREKAKNSVDKVDKSFHC